MKKDLKIEIDLKDSDMIESMQTVIESMRVANTDAYPKISNITNKGELGLWILWVARDELGIRRLNSVQIADILVESMGISVSAKSITNSFRALKGEIHKKVEYRITYYSIMQVGVDYLKSKKVSDVRLFSFSPGTEFTSRNALANDILNEFDGDIKVVDPYCGDETLDLLSSYENGKIKFLTSLNVLRDQKIKDKTKRSILRFKKEFEHVDIKDYQEYDIHDRYILSDSKMVLLGQGIKNIGNKESYAIMFDKDYSSDIIQSMTTTFDIRWKRSAVIQKIIP